MPDIVTWDVSARDSGVRVDVAVAEAVPGLSRSLAHALIRDGKVSVNGEKVRPSHRLSVGDRLRVDVLLPPSISAHPEPVPLNIAYRDSDLVVLDKPAGLVVHPAPGHAGGTVANGLAELFPESREIGDALRPGIVHRLDKDTSGLMVVALTPQAHASLQSQIAQRVAGRRYLTLVTGHPNPPEATIDAPIGRDPQVRKRMGVHGVAARPARTSYRVLEELPGFSLVEATLETGRTHQIRVHFAAVGHPVAVDQVYGGAQLPGLDRQFLHAHRLRIFSPSTGQPLEFHSPLPPDLQSGLDHLRRQRARRDSPD